MQHQRQTGKHVEVRVPIPSKGEVQLKSESVTLNPIDWKIQKCMLRPLFPRKFPHIPGNGGWTWSQNFKPGDKVAALLNHLESLFILFCMHLCSCCLIYCVNQLLLLKPMDV